LCPGDFEKMVAGPLTIVQMLPELEAGGVERGALELGKYLVQQGHRSIVISGGGRLVSQLESEGSEHVLWDVGTKSPLTLRYVPRLRKFLTQNKVDILHLRSRVPAWVGYLAWRKMNPESRPRLVTTFHGFYSVNRYSAIMARGEKVIAISKAITSHIHEEYKISPENIEFIYRGFDAEKFNPAVITNEDINYWHGRWGLPEDNKSPVIMLPGRLTRLKGHDVFIRALDRIRDLNWLAVCVGEADDNPAYRNELEQLSAGLHLDKRVWFVGHCDDMPVAYSLSDIVVSATSSRPEAFGRIAVEAQALVEPSDPESLAEAMREGLSNPGLCKEYGEAGREWVLENFTTKKMCERTLELYRNLIKMNY
jgi:glycosyltransferase involved in cell wall biosynthesis